MQAIAAFPDRRTVEVVDHPEPVVARPGDVLVRALEVGVCGTDGELCAFHFGFPPAGELYLILGHEALGVVQEVGAEVAGLVPGDLVVPSVRRPCARPECTACRTGHQDLCLTGAFTERGIFGAHGFLSERYVEDAAYLYRLSPALRSVGVLTEPLTIAEKGLRQYVAIQRRLPWLTDQAEAEILKGRRAVVLGAGPVGIVAAMLLRLRGCEVSVYSLEPEDDDRAGLVRRIGARYISAAELSVPEMAEAVGGIEMVYEAAGSAALSLAVAAEMAPNGVFILTGATGGGRRLEFGADALLNHLVIANVVIAGTVNAGHQDFVRAVSDLEIFVQRWPDAVPATITSRHAPEEFAALALSRGGIKQVVELEVTR